MELNSFYPFSAALAAFVAAHRPLMARRLVMCSQMN